MTYVVEEAALLPEDTLFSAVLLAAEEKVIPYTDKKTGEDKSFEKIEWKWLIERPAEYAGKNAFGECPTTLDSFPANRFRLIAEALLQRPLDVGTPLSLEDLVGLRADISVEHQTRVGDDRVFVKVDTVLPVSDDQPPF